MECLMPSFWRILCWSCNIFSNISSIFRNQWHFRMDFDFRNRRRYTEAEFREQGSLETRVVFHFMKHSQFDCYPIIRKNIQIWDHLQQILLLIWNTDTTCDITYGSNNTLHKHAVTLQNKTWNKILHKDFTLFNWGRKKTSVQSSISNFNTNQCEVMQFLF